MFFMFEVGYTGGGDLFKSIWWFLHAYDALSPKESRNCWNFARFLALTQ